MSPLELRISLDLTILPTQILRYFHKLLNPNPERLSYFVSVLGVPHDMRVPVLSFAERAQKEKGGSASGRRL